MDVGSILIAGFGIGLLIFLHELGHFMAARLAGVRVEVFSLGFGPRVFGRVIRGTDFRLSLVPFGGFVMVAGQDPKDFRYPARESLWSKSIAQKALFWSGGVAMNVLFALVVFPLVFHTGVSFVAPVIGTVDPGSAAWEAGLLPGDRIRAVAGKEMYSFENMSVEVALKGDRAIALDVERSDGSNHVITATPHFDAADGLYQLGITPALDPAPPVLTIAADGPGAVAGLRTGDLLVRLADQPPQSARLPDDPAAPVAVRVQRQGETIDAVITPKVRTDAAPLRIGVQPLQRQVRGVRPGHPLVDRLGIRRGDVILAIDGEPFCSGDLTAFATGAERTQWLVSRNGTELLLEQPTDASERVTTAAHIALEASADQLLLQPTTDGTAALAGLRSGDRLVRIDDHAIEDWDDLKTAVEAAGAAPLRLQVRRLPPGAASNALASRTAGDLIDLIVQPRQRPVADVGMQYRLTPLMQEVRATSPADALRLGFVCSLDLVKQFYVTLKRLVTGDVGAKNLGGIIRISQVSYQAAQRGPAWFWYFLALLSVNLAFVNLLPVPVLDGGYLLFLLIEKIKGSPINTKVLGYSQVVGLVFVLLLVLFVTYNDIMRLL